MKAFIIDRYGKKDRGRIGEMPDPEVPFNHFVIYPNLEGPGLLKHLRL